MEIEINKDWKKVLQSEFEQAYFIKLIKILKLEIENGKTIYPKIKDIFNAFNNTPFHKIKVVILGQDPYHQPNQAHGLSFSVLPPTKPPPSLQNIFKELKSDLGYEIPKNGDLTLWAKQGILLLNTYLTVKANEPMSHSKIGWEKFTNAVIKKISDEKEHIVFILWGKFAQQKKEFIDIQKHKVIESTHPSPLSANKGFFGSKPFSKTNEYLQKVNKDLIVWQ